MTEIATLAGCARITITKWMKKFKIERRTLIQACHYRSQSPEWHKNVTKANRQRHAHYAPYRDPDWLYEMYWEKGKSTREIATIVKCNEVTIWHWMKKLNVPIRSHKDVKWHELMPHLVLTPEWQRAHAEGIHRRSEDPRYHEKHAKAMRRRSKDPKWQKAHAEMICHLGLKKRGKGEMTKIEAICHEAFKSLGLDFIFEKYIYPYRVDFFFRIHGIIIEAMGEYWHKSIDKRKHDLDRKQYLEALGYTVLEWWGKDIKADVYQLIDEELLPLLGQPSRMERPPRGVCKPYRGPHGWESAIQLYLFGKEPDQSSKAL